MEPPSNHLTSPYGSPPCPPMYGPNTDYNLQHKMQDQYYPDRQQSGMGYPGLVPTQAGQSYPSMAMEQSKMADPSSYSAGSGYGRPPPDLGPMMRALTEDDLYNQQQPQQAQYRQMAAAGMGYVQNPSYPSQDNVAGYGGHTAGGQYTSPFSPGHSPRSSQFFPMHSQTATAHDGYTSPPVQSAHFGPNGPLGGQYHRQSPLMNMASPNGQSSPSIPAFSRAANHPVTAPSPVMSMQGSSSMYSSHGNSGHLSHNSPLPSPSNLRSPASVHSPKSLPATSPNTFASPSPSPVMSMSGQSHRQTRSPGASGPFQQNPAPQPYPIPSPKVRAVEQGSTVSGNTPYVELVSTRDSPLGTASNHSQESLTKAPYPPKEHSTNRGHLPQLEEMVKFLGEPTAKGILPFCDEKDNDKNTQPKETEADVNGRNCIEGKVNNSETDSSKSAENCESISVSPANVEVKDPIGTSNGPTESPVIPSAEDNTVMQQTNNECTNVVNNTPNGPDHPVKKSPRRRNSSKSPKRRNSSGQDSPLIRDNHVGDCADNVSSPGQQQMQNVDTDSKSPHVIKRRRSSSGERERRRQGTGNNLRQKSPKRRNSLKKSDDEMNSKGSPLINSEPLQASPKNNKLPRSPRRLSAEKPDTVWEMGPNGEMDIGTGEKHNPLPDPKRTEEHLGDYKPPIGAKSDNVVCVKNEECRTFGKNGEQNCGGSEPVQDTGENTPEKNRQDTSKSDGKTEEVKSESQNTSPMDVPSTSRSVTPPFKNPMTTPTLKRNTPESGGSSDLSNSSKKRRGRPVGSKNRTREEIEKEKLTKKRGPYRKRNLDPELKGELGKFKHVPKPGKVAESKISSKGPVLRIQGTLNNVVSSKVLNCPQEAQSSQNVTGKKQKKKPGRVAKRYTTMTRVPQGPATMHASEFRSVGEWVCALCGKPSNVGSLGHLYGPYYPHGYQIPPQPPKQDSTSQAKEEVEEVPPPSKGKGTRTRLKSNSPPPRGRGSSRGSSRGRGAKQTPQSGTQKSLRNSKGASGKRTPKTAKMEDFDYEYETPSVTKGGKRRPRSSTPRSSSKRPAKTTSPEPPESGRRRKKSVKDDPSRPDPNEIWVHEDCAIWAQGVYAMGSTLYGLYEAVLAARKVECMKCSEKGASMGCLSKGCKMVYHFMCAQQEGCQLQEENYSMICPEHKDKMVKMRDVT